MVSLHPLNCNGSQLQGLDIPHGRVCRYAHRSSFNSAKSPEVGSSALCFTNMETRPLRGVSLPEAKGGAGVQRTEPRQPGPEPRAGTASGEAAHMRTTRADWKRRKMGSNHLESSKLGLSGEMPWESMAGLYTI